MSVLLLIPPAAAYPIGVLVVRRHLRTLTLAQRRAAALTWPLVLARTIRRRHRYVRAGRRCADTADFVTRIATYAQIRLAGEALEFVTALRTVGQVPGFGVFLRDTATGAPFDNPAEPALAEIRAAMTRADELRRQHGT